MSRSHQALTIEELWDETQRLNAEVAALQTRLSRYETTDNIERPSAAGPGRETQDSEDGQDVWNVWPYSWAISAYYGLREGFHSFHANLLAMYLARHNKRARIAYWQKPHHEEMTLRLVSGE